MHRGHYCQERGGRFKARRLSSVRGRGFFRKMKKLAAPGGAPGGALSSPHGREIIFGDRQFPLFPENLFCVLNVDLL